MVDLSVSDGKLVLHVRGADQLWALKSSLEIPLAHIAGIRADEKIAHGWYPGLRGPAPISPACSPPGRFTRTANEFSGMCTIPKRWW